MTKFPPAPDHESPATGQLCAAPHTSSWPRCAARALWDGLPVCGVHLNAKRGAHLAAVRAEARTLARRATINAVRLAVGQLAEVGVPALANIERGGVTIKLEDIDDLVIRLTPGWSHVE